MPRLEVENAGTFDVPEGKRLVLAIEEDAGVDILHRCGSYARSTTCRIE
jgi:ferredoxin